MGRRIILLSDGTGNSSAKVWRTNVWRVFERLDLSGSSQVAYYDDGVGTSEFKPLAILGGAFGYGLKRNVLDLYKFASRNFRDDADEIYAFGFSRGAFTIRILIGLILEQGLVRASSEIELDRKAREAYRQFRRNNFHTNWYKLWQFLQRRLRRHAGAAADANTNQPQAPKRGLAGNHAVEQIRFVGLWDTVAAYGLPVDEMARGISQWIWPWQMPDYVLDRRVQRACHALSIDDERTTFHPILWDERKEAPLQPESDGTRLIGRERISQVWFAGVHSNVGGGYPDDSLAQIPLLWIMQEAERQGLQFKVKPDSSPQTIVHPLTAQDKDGRIYNPRSGLGGYYRFGPRDLTILGSELLSRQGIPGLPKIHESVLWRIGNNAHLYAPVGLPARYEVVTAKGQVIDQQQFERHDQADARVAMQARLWNLIWWRRGLYFATVAVSLYLVVYPFMGVFEPQDEYTSRLRWASDLVRLAGSALPSFASPWINAYARHPGYFLFVAIVLAGLLLYGGMLARRTGNAMALTWQQALKHQLGSAAYPNDIIYRLRTSTGYKTAHALLKRTIAPAFFAILFVYLGVTLASHAAFNIQDVAGYVCRESDQKGLAQLDRGELLLSPKRSTKLTDQDKKSRSGIFKTYADRLPVFETSNLCQSMGIKLERNARYVITFESTESFFDGDAIKASHGFYSLDAPGFRPALMLAAVPLRREWMQPWFRVVARIGGSGGEEMFLLPDRSDQFLINAPLRATRDGELFLFVNDAVIGIPGLYGVFYRRNRGSTRVIITRP